MAMKSKRLGKVTGDTIINLVGDDPYAYVYTDDKNLLKYLTQYGEPFTKDWDGETVAEWKVLKNNIMFSEAKKRNSAEPSLKGRTKKEDTAAVKAKEDTPAVKKKTRAAKDK